MNDQELRAYLSQAKTIAVLGAQGYRVLPVNPRFQGEELFGEEAVASLLDLKEPVDILDVFRPPSALMDHLPEVLALRPGLVWLQSGIRHPEFEKALKEAGIPVVADRCLMVEHKRLFRGPLPL